MKMRNANVTVMIADPPWPHANGSRTNSGKSPKYQLMNLKEIAALGPVVTKLAGDDAVLYLWATCPHLPGAIATIESWGFRYRSYLVWRKQTVASGYWARSDAEICLIAEKGYPQGPDKSSETGKPFEVSRPDAARQAQAAPLVTDVTGPSPLEQLKAGKLDFDGYLNAKVEEATEHLHGVPKVQLDQIRTMLRAQMTSDPALADLVQQATGRAPAPPEE